MTNADTVDRLPTLLRAAVRAVAMLTIVLFTIVGTAHAEFCGDADGDGALTVVDLVNTVRFILEAPNTCTWEICDANADGMVNALDIQRLVNAILLVCGSEACGCVSQACDCSLFLPPGGG